MNNKKNLFSLFILFFFLTVTLHVIASQKPKNIIFLIGDGMGLTHISATKILHGPLQMERFKITGLQATNSIDKIVTDSAAAGTALATGKRTTEGTLGLDSDKNKIKNLFEYAIEANKKTGIVVTSTMAHATPAAFSAHVESRKMIPEIARQQVLESGMSLIVAGGLDSLLPQSDKDSCRKDDLDLLSELKAKMPVVTNLRDFLALENIGKAAAFLYKGFPPQGPKRNYSLAEVTKKAIEILNHNSEGFVIMIEGSQIDIASHKNDFNELMHEVTDFDRAVGVALDFAEEDKNTLVIVTADHETGGLTLPLAKVSTKFANSARKKLNLLAEQEPNEIRIVNPHFSTDEHSACMVPVFAFGIGAERFSGIQEITDIGNNLIELIKK